MNLNQIEEQIVHSLASGEFTSAEMLQRIFEIMSAEVEVAEDLLEDQQVRKLKKSLEHIARAYHIVKQVGA